MMQSAMERGNWVFFQNCHLAPSWMPSLERLVEGIDPSEVSGSTEQPARPGGMGRLSPGRSPDLVPSIHRFPIKPECQCRSSCSGCACTP